jgi:multidrug resistance efflux pump
MSSILASNEQLFAPQRPKAAADREYSQKTRETMDKRFRAIIVVGTLVLVAIFGLVGYLAWLNITRVDTLKATVEGKIVPVRAPASARVVALPLELGDAVMAGEEVALIKTQTAQGALIVPILAPVNGIVAIESAAIGDTLSAGQPVLTLVDPDSLWISANIHQNRIPQVSVGQQVRVRISTRTKRRTFWGRVEQIGSATQSALVSTTIAAGGSMPSEVPVTISVDTEGYPLFPGMRAEVRIRLEPRPSLW